MSEIALSGRDKASILLVTLGSESAAQVLKFLDEDDIETLTTRMFQLGAIMPEAREQVLREGYQMSAVREMTNGGMEYVREVLARALGTQKAQEVIERIKSRSQGAPFDFLDEADPAQLASALKNEHPQTIALIVSHLKASKAAAILANLDGALQGDVASRIAVMDRVSPDVIKKVEGGLKGKLTNVLNTQDYTPAGGVQSLVSILHQVDRSTEKTIMETLERDHSLIAEEVRQKMFIFENIAMLDDRSIQRVLRDVDSKDLIMALKGASEEVREVIFKNLSQRAANLLREDLMVTGPVRLRNVEEAQQRIVAVIRRLEASEEIVVSRGGDDDVVM